MKQYKLIGKVWLVSTVLVLAAAGCNKTAVPEPTTTSNSPSVLQAQQKPAQPTPKTAAPQTTTPPSVQAIIYQGVDGKTALELLKATHQVDIQNYSGIGEFVKSIDGVTPDNQHFWAFFVNGKSSTVGASSYISKSSDRIEWKLDKIN